MHLIINAQTMDVHNISDYKWLNLKQNDYEEKEFIIDLGNVYCNAIEKDTAFRRQIVCFMLDSIIGQGNINSALASKILMQYSRINEYDDSCIDKILNILNNGYCNLDFLQLAGCIGDEKFNNPIYSIYNSDIKKNKLEMEMLKNTLARLGNQEMIEDRLSHFKSILNTSTNPIKQGYADALRTINYINRKEFYDMLIGYIINDNGKIIIVGDYGGDPYGGDDNIYCTLSTFLLESIQGELH